MNIVKRAQTYYGEKQGREKRNPKEVSFIRFIISLIVVIFTTAFLIVSSVHLLPETENAIITRFGNPRVVSKPGVCFSIPIIEKFTKVDMTIQGMAIGYTLDGDETIENEATMITKDFNFLDVFFYLEYRVSDPVQYLYASKNPELVLYNLFQSAIRDTIGSNNTDDILTTSRYQIQDQVSKSLSEKLEDVGIGIIINNVTIQDVEFPNVSIKNAFDGVEIAKTDADSVVTEANKYHTETTVNAEAQADKIIQDAEAAKEQRINEAEGQIARFESMYKQYLLAPENTKMRMYYEAMEEILPNIKVIITNSKGEIVNVFTEPYKSNY